MHFLKKTALYISIALVLLFLYFTWQTSTHRPAAKAVTSSVVVVMPSWWSHIDFILDNSIAHTIYPKIYFPKDQFDILTGDSPSTEVNSILVHERQHLAQYERYHPLIFIILYATSKDFRLARELEALRAQFSYLKDAGVSDYDFDWKADQFVGPTYRYMVKDKDTALKILKHLWENDEIILNPSEPPPAPKDQDTEALPAGSPDSSEDSESADPKPRRYLKIPLPF